MQSRRYNVTVQGRLGARFNSAFPGVSVEPRRGQICLVTEPFDQGQLHGLLSRVRDFGFDLISVPRPQLTKHGWVPCPLERGQSGHSRG